MILADKIINERKKLGWSQEELADKLDVSRQSVSKWESMQATPDLNRVLKMAEIFGVTTDYLLKDEIEEIPTNVIVQDTVSTKEELRSVSMEEANTYLNLVEDTAPKTALGVSLCIASPVFLMFRSAFESIGIMNDAASTVFSLSALLIMVAIAVFIFIMTGKKLDVYKYLEETNIETAYGVDGMVREKKSRFEGKHSMFVAIGVILCIVAVIPVFATALFTDAQNEHATTYAVGVLLLIIAAGVNMIVRAGSIMDSYKKLLQEGDYTPEGKKVSKTVGKIAAIYWPIVVAGYLGWSFITMRWDTTWIVWPVAAVLFGAVTGIVRSLKKD
ncbi:XRE family transcriptional regulator [Butyrivibrio sp. X503]|uniref:helix-turn-helix domain-containing protein n=1 Tax=Butyrivibrio sp. X503 TaxID=2364878 RepID=UPI000EAA4FD6|nr:helix-turn-helix transcriptional regulator [Butyrivibrio sp. X503]RKM57968.1 XRE family transcriptional regulator [Butyrivibrio sp. X503]